MEEHQPHVVLKDVTGIGQDSGAQWGRRSCLGALESHGQSDEGHSQSGYRDVPLSMHLCCKREVKSL